MIHGNIYSYYHNIVDSFSRKEILNEPIGGDNCGDCQSICKVLFNSQSPPKCTGRPISLKFYRTNTL